MSDMQSQFEQAALDSKSLSARPDNDTLLQLYALYKQATKGDASGKKPGRFDMVGRAKYDAWEKIKGMSVDDAMQTYVTLVEQLKTAG